MGVKRCWVEISGADRAELESWVRAQSVPQALAMRARVVLGSAAGESVRALAAQAWGNPGHSVSVAAALSRRGIRRPPLSKLAPRLFVPLVPRGRVIDFEAIECDTESANSRETRGAAPFEVRGAFFALAKMLGRPRGGQASRDARLKSITFNHTFAQPTEDAVARTALNA